MNCGIIPRKKKRFSGKHGTNFNYGPRVPEPAKLILISVFFEYLVSTVNNLLFQKLCRNRNLFRRSKVVNVIFGAQTSYTFQSNSHNNEKQQQQQQKTKTDAISFPCLPQKTKQKTETKNKTKQDETKEKVSRRSRSPRYVNDVAD